MHGPTQAYTATGERNYRNVECVRARSKCVTWTWAGLRAGFPGRARAADPLQCLEATCAAGAHNKSPLRPSAVSCTGAVTETSGDTAAPALGTDNLATEGATRLRNGEPRVKLPPTLRAPRPELAHPNRVGIRLLHSERLAIYEPWTCCGVTDPPLGCGFESSVPAPERGLGAVCRCEDVRSAGVNVATITCVQRKLACRLEGFRGSCTASSTWRMVHETGHTMTLRPQARFTVAEHSP